MGMPFPLGLARVEARCAAHRVGLGHQRLRVGHGAVLATLLAIHLGFTAVVLAALVLYGAAAAASP